MKKFILGLIAVLVLLILVYVANIVFNFLPSSKNETGITMTVKCSTQKNLCEKFTSSADSGSLKITILTYTGTAAKNLEVDLGAKPGAPVYFMKYTDKNGLAEFDGISAGAYVLYFNGITFLKEYGSSSITERIEINKNQTTEKIIRLLPGS